LERPDRVIGMACSDGTYVGERCIDTRDGSGSDGARMVLLSPRVQAAILETAPTGVRWEGLGFDLCDVAVVTDVAPAEHRGIENPEEAARITRTVIEVVARTGTAVLNADDPRVAAMAGHCPGAVIYFTREEGNLHLAAQRSKGGRAVFFRRESIVLAEGEREEVLISLTHQGERWNEKILAATAAAWALGTPLEQIRAGLTSFADETEQVPDREADYAPTEAACPNPR
jgi:cyanophycin synthetase